MKEWKPNFNRTESQKATVIYTEFEKHDSFDVIRKIKHMEIEIKKNEKLDAALQKNKLVSLNIRIHFIIEGWLTGIKC